MATISRGTPAGTLEPSFDPPAWEASLSNSFHKIFQLTSSGYSKRFDIEKVSTELENVCETVMNLSKSDQSMCAEKIGQFITKLAPFIAQVYYGELWSMIIKPVTYIIKCQITILNKHLMLLCNVP